MHPTSNKTYIVSGTGGVDNSPEGQQVRWSPSVIFCVDVAQGGFTHGFVVEFASKEDRDYYVSKDPVHQEFVKKNSPSFDDVRVIDYEKGVY